MLNASQTHSTLSGHKEYLPHPHGGFLLPLVHRDYTWETCDRRDRGTDIRHMSDPTASDVHLILKFVHLLPCSKFPGGLFVVIAACAANDEVCYSRYCALDVEQCA